MGLQNYLNCALSMNHFDLMLMHDNKINKKEFDEISMF